MTAFDLPQAFLHWLSLDTDLLELPDLGVFDGDWRMSQLPLFLEVLKLFPVGLASIMSFIVFFDLGDSFKLLDDLLVVASALGRGPIVEVLFKSFENL